MNRARDKNQRPKCLFKALKYEKLLKIIVTMKILASTIISLLLLTSLVYSQDSIGFSFNSNRDNTPFDENTVAGVVPSPGWVSTDGGVDAQGGANGTIEYNGVTVEWSCNGTWNTNNGVDNGDNQVMNGYIDAVGGGGYADVTISGIESFTFGANYDLYVYFGSDGNGRTGAVESTTAGQIFSYTTDSQKGGFDPELDYILTEDETDSYPPANYCVFREQSGSDFSVQINRGSSNSGIHGIQIVSLGPGTPFEMTDILYNKETDEFTLTWNSKPNQTYALYVSENLEEWDFDLDDSIISDGDTTTYGPFENPMPGSRQLFFRAEETDEE